MQRDCYKKKADKAKRKGKPGGGGREGGHGSGPHAGAALAQTALTGNAGSSKAHESTRALSTWMLDSGATNHMAAGDKGFTVRTAGSGAEVTLANGDKVPIKGHGHVSMDVGKGKTKTHMILGEAMLVSDLTSNLLSVRAVDAGFRVWNSRAWAPKPKKCDFTLSPPHSVGGRASGTVLPGSPVGKYPPRKKSPKSTHARRRPGEGAASNKNGLCDRKPTCPRRRPRGNNHASPSYPIRSPRTLRNPSSVTLKGPLKNPSQTPSKYPRKTFLRHPQRTLGKPSPQGTRAHNLDDGRSFEYRLKKRRGKGAT